LVYLHIAIKTFQRHLAYRAANLAGITTNTFFGAIYVYVYVALFQTRSQVGGLDLRDTITYAVLTQSLLMVMSTFGNHDLSNTVVSGEIVTDLSRPVDFYGYWAAIDFGRAVYFILFRGFPTFFIGMLLFRPRLPQDPFAFFAFGTAILLGLAVSFAFRFIGSSLAFWTVDAVGIRHLTETIVIFFSGFAVPLNFFPAPLRWVAERLPFSSLAHLPVSAYLGTLNAAELLQALAWQLLWLLVLVALGRLLLAKMQRRLTVQGG
jgi:ABC-2 type transport system permease protein